MAKKPKKAIALTPEQTARSNKLGVMIYGMSFLGWLLIMLITHTMSAPGMVVMLVCFILASFWGLCKGSEENTHIKMSVMYLIPYIAVTFTSAAKIYPIVFITVYALIVYQNVRLVSCGTAATVIINLVSIGYRSVQGQMTGGDATIEFISTMLFGFFSMYTVFRIYNATKDNMDQIQKQTNEAIEVANQVGQISQDILDNFHVITDGMHDITEQANENKGALSDISSASSVNSQEMSHQSELTQNIYAIVQETQASAERVQQNAEEVYEKVSEGAVLSEDMRTQAQAVSGDIEATNQIITDLVAQIQGVSSITDAILSISSQTNLLALNASIEAARAGEAGKGFAVVADEIRQLADSSRETANNIQEISKLVIGSVEKLASNSQNMLAFIDEKVMQDYDGFVKVVEQYEADADSINEVLGQFAAKTDEIRNTVEDMNNGINDISTAIDENAQDVTGVAQNAVSLVEAMNKIQAETENNQAISQQLNEQVNRFKRV